MTDETIPVILFAYCRPEHLRRTLNSLRKNQVPLIYAFSDGPASRDKETAVAQVRNILRSIDWCTVILIERSENWGLGRSILAGVSEVFRKHETCIVFEDDLVCVQGTYEYMAAALRHYKGDQRVMSVTGWTHPNLTPSDVTDEPYFDGRAECWVWGTWRRVWQGMGQDAATLMKQCERKGIDIYSYGADLPDMARIEQQKNIWAVRFLYWHILNYGLCLRPPWSMVEHIGFDNQATNAGNGDRLANPPLQTCPLIPKHWPEPREHTECIKIHQAFWGTRPGVFIRFHKFVHHLGKSALSVFYN